MDVTPAAVITAATTFSGTPTRGQLAAGSFAMIANVSDLPTFVAEIDTSAFVGTLTFYGLEVNGTELVLISGHLRNSSTIANNTAINTAVALNQVWVGSIASFQALYVVCTAFTSGNVTVQPGLSAAPYALSISTTVTTADANVSTDIGTPGDTSATSDTGTFDLIQLVKRLLTKLSDDNTNELKVSLYGKTSAAGDTPLLLDAAGQMTIEDFIRYQIMAGHGYSCELDQFATGGANAFVGIQLVANSITKNILVYRATVFQAQTSAVSRLYIAPNATADAGLTGAGTAVNHGGGGATALSSINVSPAATTETSGFQGSIADVTGNAASANVELLQNGQILFIPKSTAGSISLYTKVVTSGQLATIALFWIEF